MKFAVVSDLHVETRIDAIHKIIDPILAVSDEADVLLVAGDVCSGKYKDLLLDVFAVISKHFEWVVYVAGNHEYWHSSWDEVWENMRYVESQIPNLVILENTLTSLDGITIYGGTLWFANSELARAQEHQWPDFRYVNGPNLSYRRGHEFKAQFPSGEVDIVITHHMPTEKSVSARWQHNLTNCYFVHDCEDLIPQAKVWVHGHTHDKFDYMFGDTRIICNPLGYPGERKSANYIPLIFEL